MSPVKPTERTRIGNVTVTRLGLGTAPLGGLFSPVHEETARSTVQTAWELGLRFFDTAPLYGYGNAELRLGAGLAARPRGDFVIETKVGRLLRQVTGDADWDVDKTQAHDGEPFYKATGPAVPVFDFSYEGAMRSFEESLGRLGLDRVDIVLVHDPDDHVEQAIKGACRAMCDLREQGVIGAVGVGIDHAAPAVRIMKAVELDCVLIAGRWTLLDHEALDSLLPEAAQRGVGIVAAGVFNSGVLADPDTAATFDYVPATVQVMQRVHDMAAVCARYDVPLKAAALQFPYRHRAVAAVLTGARSPEELTENFELAGVHLPDALWHDLARECGVPLEPNRADMS